MTEQHPDSWEVEAAKRINQLAVLVDFTRRLERYAKDTGNKFLAEKARNTLAAIKGEAMTDAELIARLRDADLYNAQHYERDPLHKQAADRIEALTAKLAKAMEALQWCAMYGDGDVALATLAEIKGESYE